MGAGFVGALMLLVFCAFAPGRVAFDERAYTCLCCLAPYTFLLGGGWWALWRSEPGCGRGLFFLLYVFGVVYVAYFSLAIVAAGALYAHCRRRGPGPFRGVPLAFLVVFAPLHILMPGMPVMPLAYLWRGPGRRRRSSSDPEAGDVDTCTIAPRLVDAEASEVEMLTPRSVVRVLDDPVVAKRAGVRKTVSGPIITV